MQMANRENCRHGELDIGEPADGRCTLYADGRHVVTVNANGTACVFRFREWTSERNIAE
jgi:hypothetical protein